MGESGQRENIPQAETEKPVNKLAVAAFIVAFVALVCAVFTLRVFLGSIELMGTIDDMAKDPEGGAGGAVIATFGLVPLIAVWLVLGFVGTGMALVSVGLGAGAVSVRKSRRANRLWVAAFVMDGLSLVSYIVCFIIYAV